MEKGYLLLVGNYIDLVHYIKLKDTYYTLSRDNVEKIVDYKNGVDFYIKKVKLHDLETSRETDPYYMSNPRLTDEEREFIIEGCEFSKIEINISRNSERIIDFHNLSVANDFAYFDDIDAEPIVLLEYKEIT